MSNKKIKEEILKRVPGHIAEKVTILTIGDKGHSKVEKEERTEPDQDSDQASICDQVFADLLKMLKENGELDR